MKRIFEMYSGSALAVEEVVIKPTAVANEPLTGISDESTGATLNQLLVNINGISEQYAEQINAAVNALMEGVNKSLKSGSEESKVANRMVAFLKDEFRKKVDAASD